MDLRRLLPPIVFAAAILGASGSWVSSGVTGRVAQPWLLALGLDAATAEAVHAFLRKCGHFLAYGAFAWVVLRSLRGARPATRALALVAWLLAGALASLDEGLQSLTPDRGGSAWDVLLDLTGASCFLLLALRRGAPTDQPR